MHILLRYIREYFEDSGWPLGSGFGKYDSLAVLPNQIYKSKEEHKKAVFLLAKGLSMIVFAGNQSHVEQMRNRFLRLAGAVSRDEPQITDPHDRELPAFALNAISHGPPQPAP